MQHDRHERRRQGEEQPQRSRRNDLHAGNVEQRAGNHDGQCDPPSAIAFLEPREHAGQVGDEQRGINRHVENGRDQREPGFLKSPEVAHGAAHPGVVAALVGQRAREFADHEGGRQAPEQRGEQQNQDGASVTGAVHDVFGAIGSARHHKEGGGDQGPKREADEFLPVGDDGERLGCLELLRGALAVANFYGFLLKRLTLTTASPLKCLAAPGLASDFPGISAKLVRICEITGNFHRCKIFLDYFANFCKRGCGTEVMAWRSEPCIKGSHHGGHRGTRGDSIQSLSSQVSETKSVRLQLLCFSWATRWKPAFW